MNDQKVTDRQGFRAFSTSFQFCAPRQGPARVVVSNYLLQVHKALDFNIFTIYCDELEVSEMGKQTAHSFRCEAEIARDVLPRHRQSEMCSGVTTSGESL